MNNGNRILPFHDGLERDYPATAHNANGYRDEIGVDNLAFSGHATEGSQNIICENRENELHEMHCGTGAHDDVSVVNVSNKQLPGKDYKSLMPFCVVVGVGTLFSQSVSVYLTSQITVLERAFGLSSSTSGLLLSANDIGFVLTVLLASHFLKNHHIPRVIALCIFTFGISGILTSLPHFIDGNNINSHSSGRSMNITSLDQSHLCVPGYHSNQTYEEKCLAEQRETNTDSSSSSWVVVLIGITMALQGVAKAPRTPLSSVYVDNNSEKEKTGFYIGVLMSFTIFGPFLAITVGGLFNKLPVDLKETNLTPEDPRWIGAWWLGFIVFGACSLLISVPIFFFPRSINVEAPADDKNAEYVNSTAIESGPSFTTNLKDLPKSIFRVLKQPVFLCNMVSALFVIFAFLAMGSFGPKYVETQFQIPTWKANVISGLEKLVTTSAGTFIGGTITRRLRLGLSGCVKMMLLSRLCSFACQCFNFIWSCDTPDIIGWHTERSAMEEEMCECTDSPFLPVCGEGRTYFSPCYAGCTSEINGIYSNCTLSSGELYGPGLVSTGFCNADCYQLIPYVAINAIGSLIGTMTIAPSYVTILRSVKEKDRSIAVGIQSFVMALLVLLPAPIVYGKVFDSLCLVWRTTCSGVGACSLYDVKGMRIKLTGVNVGMFGVGLLFTCCTYFLAIRKEADDKKHQNKSIELKPPVPQPRPSLSKADDEH